MRQSRACLNRTNAIFDSILYSRSKSNSKEAKIVEKDSHPAPSIEKIKAIIFAPQVRGVCRERQEIKPGRLDGCGC